MNRLTLLFCLAFLITSVTFAVPTIIYVDADAVGADNGSSWTDAFVSLEDALGAVTPPAQIWVAEGVYFPESVYSLGAGDPRNKHFEMINGVAIYGGFAGGEALLTDRDFNAHSTVLSGDIEGTPVDPTDNCYNVIRNPVGIDNTAILDGFNIIQGRGADGAGMYNFQASPTVSNCYFSDNAVTNNGGGMYNLESSPIITNCIFSANESTLSYGGAIFNMDASSILITNCAFINNLSTGGGAIYNLSAHSTLTNCVFENNYGTNTGAIYNGGNSQLVVKNSTFVQNNAASGAGAIYSTDGDGATLTITNCILWEDYVDGDVTEIVTDVSGTATVSYSCLAENPVVYSASNNCISSDPLFSDADGVDNIYGNEDDDLTLQNISPCTGTGTSTGAPAADILGISRGTVVSMGAFENNSGDPMPVELASFAASKVKSGVALTWNTATEVNNYGFEVERSVGSNWEKIGFVKGAGNSNSPKEYSFVDENPSAGKVQYRLKQINTDGSFAYYNQIAELNFNLTDVNGAGRVPTEYALQQNYPNPFNPSTRIQYAVPANVKGEMSNVKLTVYDILGNEVATLVNEHKAAGYYEVEFNASNLATGVYVYRLSAGSFTAVKKLMLMK